MPAPPIQYTNIRDIRTAWAVIGDGPPVLLLHGWGANMALVWSLAEKLAAEGFRVYALDLPGFGETPAPSETWTVHNYAAHVLAFMDAQSLEQVLLFGHSFGGRISIVLGVNHPERFEKIVLCDSAGVKPPTPWYRQLPATMFGMVEGLLGDLPFIAGLRDRYRQAVGSTDYLNAGELRNTFLEVISEDLLPIAPRLSVPTLLTWGGRDEDTPLWQGKALEAAIPDAGLVVFPQAGHYSYLDALPDTVRVMSYFYTHDE